MKSKAVGTARELETRLACSLGLAAERSKYAIDLSKSLLQIPRGSKEWWTKSRELLRMKGTCDGIPALKAEDGSWVRTALDKANLLATTFAGEIHVPAAEENEYSVLRVDSHSVQAEAQMPSAEFAEHILQSLKTDSATGPYLLPSRILKACAKYLAEPLGRFASKIIDEGRWPEIWIDHWIAPFFSRERRTSTQAIIVAYT